MDKKALGKLQYASGPFHIKIGHSILTLPMAKAGGVSTGE